MLPQPTLHHVLCPYGRLPQPSTSLVLCYIQQRFLRQSGICTPRLPSEPHATRTVLVLQVASAQHPSGLMLHSAAAFQAEYGFQPAAYPDFLALVGKKEASITGVGVSAKLAKTLLAK